MFAFQFYSDHPWILFASKLASPWRFYFKNVFGESNKIIEHVSEGRFLWLKVI